MILSNKYMSKIIFLYTPGYLKNLIYMLQSTEYSTYDYLKWFWRTNDFSTVNKRRNLEMTKTARLLLVTIVIGYYFQLTASVLLLTVGIDSINLSLVGFGLGLIFFAPVVWAHLVIIPIELGRIFVTKPRNSKKITDAEKIFKNHQAIKIAVLGSYGKTSMKELLNHVLSTELKVASTPGNKNVSISHARFAMGLVGDEDVLIIEYGEGQPGDVVKFAANTHPDIAIITGITAAHLDKYKSLDAIAKDIMSISKFVQPSSMFINKNSTQAYNHSPKGSVFYSDESVKKALISNIKIDYQGTSFDLTIGKNKLNVKTKLLGKHNVGPIALSIIIGKQFNIPDKKLLKNISSVEAYEHRMQPRHLNGAWIIDDTYNGNIEGMRVGLELLKKLPAKRKIYVTPGLVDQGPETESVHKELGQLIANANPDKLVLMQNSVTNIITDSLKNFDFKGELHIEVNPLRFYSNLDQFLAKGDLVLMQNDWTDNYN